MSVEVQSLKSPFGLSMKLSVEDRMIGLMRLILASTALALIYIDPSEPDRHIPLTYAALLLYVAFSTVVFLLSEYSPSLLKSFRHWIHWVDVGWYILFISLSSGTSSIFFFFFFFSILVASFRWGFASGLRVVVVSSLLFTLIGYISAPAGPKFELNRFLLRPICLLVLGYMNAYWGGFEITLKRRLGLLREIMMLSNPRFGINQTVGSIIKRLREFYDADMCLVVMQDKEANAYQMRRITRLSPNDVPQVETISAEFASILLSIPAEKAAIYQAKSRLLGAGHRYYLFDLVSGEKKIKSRESVEQLAETLDARSFITVPVSYRGQATGRLYLTSKQCAFIDSDVDFLLQVIEQALPVIDNIRLVNRLASDAAQEERLRIARDIHDSVIQPYIGLRIGLGAVKEKLEIGGFDVTEDVRQLFASTDKEIEELRRYTYRLREGINVESSLLPAVRRFVKKFSEVTGISVEVEAPTQGLQVNDRLAAEAFQIIAEGLSNIRRHTESSRASIRLYQDTERFIIKIENETVNQLNPQLFTPRSISERAEALGGTARVEQKDDRSTVIIIEIQL
ncbi:MAG: hypothetical protein ICV60_23265 [Pyrinomonadaceae bacterium]|nr:hypothetical protein [Pyrinomonadaceae bacterium]